TLLILSQAALIPIFEAGIILAAHIDFHPRYFIVGVPATLMLIALGLNTLTARQAIMRLAFAGATILAGVITIRMLGVTYSSPIYQHDDFRSIAERLRDQDLKNSTMNSHVPNLELIIPYGWEPS